MYYSLTVITAVMLWSWVEYQKSRAQRPATTGKLEMSRGPINEFSADLCPAPRILSTVVWTHNTGNCMV